MQTNAATSRPPPTPTESIRLRDASLVTSERLDVAYADGDGRAFTLSISRETSVRAVTYDREARLDGEERSAQKGARALEKDLKSAGKELEHAFRDMDLAVDGFKQLLHRFLKAVDQDYAARVRDLRPASGIVTEHAEFFNLTETVTIEMDVVDPGYWSVDATAGRLVDFAVGLFGGGDREAHREAMVNAMETGYQEAARAFGGWLPDISRETVDLAKERLAEWAQEGAPKALATGDSRLDLVA